MSSVPSMIIYAFVLLNKLYGITSHHSVWHRIASYIYILLCYWKPCFKTQDFQKKGALHPVAPHQMQLDCIASQHIISYTADKGDQTFSARLLLWYIQIFCFFLSCFQGGLKEKKNILFGELTFSFSPEVCISGTICWFPFSWAAVVCLTHTQKKNNSKITCIHWYFTGSSYKNNSSLPKGTECGPIDSL